METFDIAVRHCLEAVCTGPLSAEAWLQTSLETTAGRFGLRHACIHAPAGYASSVLATQPLCQHLDPDYLPSSVEGAILAVNRLLPAGDQFPVPAPPPLRQRQLSQALEKVLISRLTAAGLVGRSSEHISSCCSSPVLGRGCMRRPRLPLDCMWLGRSSRLWSVCGCGSRWLWVTPPAPFATEWRTATVTMPGFARVVATAQSATTACGRRALPDRRQLELVPHRGGKT